MTSTFQSQFLAVKEKFKEITDETRDERKDSMDKIKVILESTTKYDQSWTGEWVEDPNSYRLNFNRSDPNEMQATTIQIKNDLQTRTGINIDNLRSKLTPLSQSFFKLREFILTELSFIKDTDYFKTETELLQQIDEFKWGINPDDYIRSQRPKAIFTYDPSIINRGIVTPPHLVVGAEGIYIFSLLASYDNFEKLAYRLIRQLEIKSSTSSEETSDTIFQIKSLHAIIEKFHTACTQLKNRYDSRPTIKVDDEYDVQDIMNALLHISFENVKKEEYTPSYAGSSTRIDFLLPREKILIEVKKTRPTLTDKEVGRQLILDIIHYKTHPDCKHLICFVYDPDNLIVNPRGLEDDLNKNSSEDMVVEVYVRP